MNAALLQELLAGKSADLVAHSEVSAKQWERLAKQIERRMLRLLEVEGRPVTPEEAARVLSELRKVLGMGARDAMTLADKEALQVLQRSFAAQSEFFASAYEAESVFAVRAGNVSRTFRHFDQQLQSGEFLRDPYWQQKRIDWGQDFIDRSKELKKSVQRRMTQSMATGEPVTTRDLAAGLRSQIDGINTGTMDADQWARSYARTEYQQLYNEFSEQLATEAGVDKYVNVGVSDERQSEICYRASQQPPMTMAEWDASEWGRPGSRHVFNCRCIAGAVPDALEDDDWTQPNPQYEEVTV